MIIFPRISERKCPDIIPERVCVDQHKQKSESAVDLWAYGGFLDDCNNEI